MPPCLEGPALTVAAAIVAVLTMLLVAGAPRPRPARPPPRLAQAGGPPAGTARLPASRAPGPDPPCAPPPSAEPAGPPEASPKSRPAGEGFRFSGEPSAAGLCLTQTPEQRSVYAALDRLYSTADADPLVTGQLYGYADGVRRVYSQRTSLEDRQGLTEFNSSALPGDVGVDVGPFGLDKAPETEGADDGIPENWRFPSTPVRWYAPRMRDFYGPEGPTPYAGGLYELREPDHDPKMP